MIRGCAQTIFTREKLLVAAHRQFLRGKNRPWLRTDHFYEGKIVCGCAQTIFTTVKDASFQPLGPHPTGERDSR
jgi:hypothetical protein